MLYWNIPRACPFRQCCRASGTFHLLQFALGMCNGSCCSRQTGASMSAARVIPRRTTARAEDFAAVRGVIYPVLVPRPRPFVVEIRSS